MMSNLGFKAIQFIPELRETEHPQRQPGLGRISSALVFPVCWLETENTTKYFHDSLFTCVSCFYSDSLPLHGLKS